MGHIALGEYTPPLNMMVRHGSMLKKAVNVFFRLWPLQANWHQPLSFPAREFWDLDVENPYYAKFIHKIQF